MIPWGVFVLAMQAARHLKSTAQGLVVSRTLAMDSCMGSLISGLGVRACKPYVCAIACILMLQCMLPLLDVLVPVECCDNWGLEHRPSVSVHLYINKGHFTNISKARLEATIKSQDWGCSM